MTQADKELLLKDLCARLPYGVKVDVINEDNEHHIVKIGEGNIGHLGKGFWKECKPYLFPLSSMTEEQKEKALSLLNNCNYYIIDGTIKWLDNCPMEFFDWCNSHHFDYRGLIPMGLANDATGLNIY